VYGDFNGNRRTQRQNFKQKITEIAKGVLLVRDWDQSESKAITERISKDESRLIFVS
jgi:hypothetical protein